MARLAVNNHLHDHQNHKEPWQRLERDSEPGAVIFRKGQMSWAPKLGAFRGEGRTVAYEIINVKP